MTYAIIGTPVYPSKVELVALARRKAQGYGLDPVLLCAVVEQESGWNPYATHYDPGFFRKYTAPLFTSSKIDLTEAQLRATSWGLMQDEGQTAREHGYTGELAALCDPATGLEIGARILKHKLGISNGDVRHALLIYNGDPEYPDRVLARMVNYYTEEETTT
jgi:soluble lytic murein transglycosylase-like protein